MGLACIGHGEGLVLYGWGWADGKGKVEGKAQERERAVARYIGRDQMGLLALAGAVS